MTEHRSVMERVAARLVEAPGPLATPCRLFTGYRTRKGYGVTWRHPDDPPGSRFTHRVMWEAENGPVPAGRVLRHRCDTPACCRADHLDLGTVAENNEDTLRRGRDELTVSDLRAGSIRAGYLAGRTIPELARSFNVAPSTVRRIVTGQARRPRLPPGRQQSV